MAKFLHRSGFPARACTDWCARAPQPMDEAVPEFLVFMAIGLLAQLVDGSIGMAYGLTATTLLIGHGIAPAAASASVHAAELFTTAASGVAHWRLKNLDWKLLKRLALPGALGGAIGAYFLSTSPVGVIRPLVDAYLILMGTLIVWRCVRAARHGQPVASPGHGLGFFGGLLDAVGGGGWGTLVTTTLIGRGVPARLAIGTANAAEFFVAATITTTFVLTVGLGFWSKILGLVLGGIMAAPFGALAAKHVPERALRLVVGIVVIGLGIRNLLLSG